MQRALHAFVLFALLGSVWVTFDRDVAGQISQPGLPLATADGQIPIAASTGVYTAATLTAGNGITITNAANSVTLASAVKVYTATIADANNTAVETTVVSFSVPANEMADGNVLTLLLSLEAFNNTGGAATPTTKFKWGATSSTLPTNAWSSNAVAGSHIVPFYAQRVGNDLWLSAAPTAGNVPFSNIGADLVASSLINTTVMTAPTFTSTQTVVLTVTLPSASPNLYWKQKAARVWRVGS